MAIKKRTKADPSFSMSSMTDIVFLLLIFFLVTSTLVNPNALKLLLPKSSNQVSAQPTLSISIKHYPEKNICTYHINGEEKPIAYNKIEEMVQKLLQDSDNPTFSIYSDGTAPIEKTVQLMNIAKRNNYIVILATAPE